MIPVIVHQDDLVDDQHGELLGELSALPGSHWEYALQIRDPDLMHTGWWFHAGYHRGERFVPQDRFLEAQWFPTREEATRMITAFSAPRVRVVRRLVSPLIIDG